MQMVILQQDSYLPVIALNMKDCAVVLGFKKPTSHKGVLLWLDKERIPVHKVNGENRVYVKDLEKYFEGKK